jgi:hypothetical protein
MFAEINGVLFKWSKCNRELLMFNGRRLNTAFVFCDCAGAGVRGTKLSAEPPER